MTDPETYEPGSEKLHRRNRLVAFFGATRRSPFRLAEKTSRFGDAVAIVCFVLLIAVIGVLVHAVLAQWRTP